jgi:hypothetical protein
MINHWKFPMFRDSALYFEYDAVGIPLKDAEGKERTLAHIAGKLCLLKKITGSSFFYF